MTEASAEDLRAWNKAAASYSAQVGQQQDPTYERFRDFIWENCGDVRGRPLLDLGCGTGWLSALCAERGARVTAVDGSAALLEAGRRTYPGQMFHLADLSAGLPEPVRQATFELVLAHMVLMDVADLTQLATDLRAVTEPGAILIATILHPSFFMQPPHDDPSTGDRYRKVRGYLRHEEWWIESFGGHRHYHRPLTFYVRFLADSGFAVADLVEPPIPLSKPESECDDYEKWRSGIPSMLGLAAVRLPDNMPGDRFVG